MNIQLYKQRLLDLEKALSDRIGHEADQGRGEFIDSAHDVGDASVADEAASEEFTEAEHNSAVLQQVRDALGRSARRLPAQRSVPYWFPYRDRASEIPV